MTEVEGALTWEVLSVFLSGACNTVSGSRVQASVLRVETRA